jgi:GR25 family glycosyltransferase involved in LPS biosynthesis
VTTVDLHRYFDRVAVINLRRRPDRWERFERSLDALDWPFKPPTQVPAVDGDAVGVPVWWKQGGGAWGCLMSHVRILEDCFRDGVERVLIMEDDVVFVDDFAARIKPFLEHVPDDWDQLYLGGQHLRDPVPENDFVYRCVNVNRTHCHAVSRRFMPAMYRHILNAHDYIANPGHHVDHRLGALHETGGINVFSPIKWLAGQGESRSDISGRFNSTYFWNTWADVASTPMVAVLGLHQAHANKVAGLMQELGVHFGHRVGGYEGPKVEDEGLARICERVFPFPEVDRRLSPEESSRLLRDWCRLILREAADYGTMGAACYPHLCAMYPDLSRAWTRIRAIDVATGFDEAVRNLKERSGKEQGWLAATDGTCEKVQAFLQEGKDEWRRHCDVLTVDPARLDEDREGLAADLHAFLTRDGGSSA